MHLTFFLFASTCLSVPVLSQNSLCKNIPDAPNFNFTEFIQYNSYTYLLATDTPETRTYRSASETVDLVGDKYVTTLSVTKYNGSKVTTKYQIESVDGATINKLLLQNDAPTNKTFAVTVYAFSPQNYYQLYVCGPTGIAQDLRFTILIGSYRMPQSLKKELYNNDNKFGFTGSLLRIGGIIKNDGDFKTINHPK